MTDENENGSGAAEDLMRYDLLAQSALRQVVKLALMRVEREGLPGNHHFFIAFDTTRPDVGMSERLRKKYPEEMTIIIQHQFWNLKVHANRFEVDLSFDNIPEKLVIPFDAIKGFFDPAVQFGLQFEVSPVEQETILRLGPDAGDDIRRKAETEVMQEPSGEAEKIVSLDAFRKK